MSSGIYGFVIDDVEKIGFAIDESEPHLLGIRMLDLAKALTPTDYERVRGIRVVTDADPVTDNDCNQYMQYADTRVRSGDPYEWYVLLRHLQGWPSEVLRAGIVLDSSDFARHSRECEWGYIIDLDAQRLEVYRGFQDSWHGDGRFANRDALDWDHFPIRLVASWPLNALPSDDVFAGLRFGELREPVYDQLRGQVYGQVGGQVYGQMPPMLPGEDAAQYTDRLTGADGTNRRPYDHQRNRQCSIGWHSECSDPDGEVCKCPCHTADGRPYRVAVTVFLTVPGVDYTEAVDGGVAAVRATLDGGAALGDGHDPKQRVFPVVHVMDARAALGGGYIWPEPSGRAWTDHGVDDPGIPD